MKRANLLLCLIAIVTVCETSRAQTQGQMNHVSAIDFEKADSDLNKAYTSILSSLSRDEKVEFIAAQRAWLTYRDAQATFQANIAAKGGTMRPLIYNTTRTRLTEERIKEMKNSVSVKEDGKD